MAQILRQSSASRNYNNFNENRTVDDKPKIGRWKTVSLLKHSFGAL